MPSTEPTAKGPLNWGLFKGWRFKGFPGTVLEGRKVPSQEYKKIVMRVSGKHKGISWKGLNLSVHSQNSERQKVFVRPRTYCKLACDSIKTNMNCVLKIWRKRNLWPFLFLLFICCKRNREKEIKTRTLLHFSTYSALCWNLGSFRGQGCDTNSYVYLQNPVPDLDWRRCSMQD